MVLFSKVRGTGWLAAKMPWGSTALRMPLSCVQASVGVRRAGVDGVLGEVEVLPAVGARRQRPVEPAASACPGHPSPGWRRSRPAKITNSAVEVAAARRRPRAATQRAAELAELGHQQRRPRRPGRPGQEGVDRGVREARPASRCRRRTASPPSGSMCSRTSDVAGTRRRCPSRAQRAQVGRAARRPARRRAEHGAVDHDQLAAAEELRQLGHRGQPHHPERGGDLVRRDRRPRGPGAQHLLGVLACPRAGARRTPSRWGTSGTPAR